MPEVMPVSLAAARTDSSLAWAAAAAGTSSIAANPAAAHLTLTLMRSIPLSRPTRESRAVAVRSPPGGALVPVRSAPGFPAAALRVAGAPPGPVAHRQPPH